MGFSLIVRLRSDMPYVTEPPAITHATEVSRPANCRNPSTGSSLRPSQLSKLFALLLGLGSRLNVQIIGYLPLSEITCLLALPFALPKISQPAIRKLTGWLVPLGLLWMLNAVITDVVMQTQWSLAARGFARILIYVACIPFFTAFLQRDAYAKTLFFTLGQVPSGILSAYFFRSGVHEGREFVSGRAAEISFETHWGAVFGLATQFVLLIVYPRSRILAYAIGFGMAAYQLVGGSRATAGIYLTGVTVCIVRDFFESRGGLRTRDKKLLKWFMLIVVTSAIVFAGLNVYKYFASTGELGEKAYQKYQAQSKSSYGILFGGRPQILGGFLAVKDSPIIGYGSWPLDDKRFFAQACELLNLNLDPTHYSRGYPLIPTHSHVLGAWVENGISGLLFWLYVLCILARNLMVRFRDPRFGLFLVISCVAAIWHISFSPMAGRLEHAFLLGLLLNQKTASGVGGPQVNGRTPLGTVWEESARSAR